MKSAALGARTDATGDTRLVELARSLASLSDEDRERLAAMLRSE